MLTSLSRPRYTKLNLNRSARHRLHLLQTTWPASTVPKDVLVCTETGHCQRQEENCSNRHIRTVLVWTLLGRALIIAPVRQSHQISHNSVWISYLFVSLPLQLPFSRPELFISSSTPFRYVFLSASVVVL